MKYSQLLSLAAISYIAPHMHASVAMGCGVVCLILSWLAYWRKE
jgi:hypothetical protein